MKVIFLFSKDLASKIRLISFSKEKEDIIKRNKVHLLSSPSNVLII